MTIKHCQSLVGELNKVTYDSDGSVIIEGPEQKSLYSCERGESDQLEYEPKYKITNEGGWFETWTRTRGATNWVRSMV